MIQGIDSAIKRMRNRRSVLRGTRGKLYKPDLTEDVQEAIRQNHDASYTGSDALNPALQSAYNWIHSTTMHRLFILSYMWANYRQYGCGGIAIAKLVTFTEYNIRQMRDRLARVLHEAA